MSYVHKCQMVVQGCWHEYTLNILRIYSQIKFPHADFSRRLCSKCAVMSHWFIFDCLRTKFLRLGNVVGSPACGEHRATTSVAVINSCWQWFLRPHPFWSVSFGCFALRLGLAKKLMVESQSLPHLFVFVLFPRIRRFICLTLLQIILMLVWNQDSAAVILIQKHFNTNHFLA